MYINRRCVTAPTPWRVTVYPRMVALSFPWASASLGMGGVLPVEYYARKKGVKERTTVFQLPFLSSKAKMPSVRRRIPRLQFYTVLAKGVQDVL